MNELEVRFFRTFFLMLNYRHLHYFFIQRTIEFELLSSNRGASRDHCCDERPECLPPDT